MDSITQQRLAAVHPVLCARVTEFLTDLEAKHGEFRVTQGLRTMNEQNALWYQGRKSLLTVNGARAAVRWAAITDIENRKTVTDAQAGYSAHNFGYAIDFVPANPSFPQFTPDWNRTDSTWKEILSLAPSYGLSEGAAWCDFPDFPHLYLKELSASPTDDMRNTFTAAGLMSVWKEWEPLFASV